MRRALRWIATCAVLLLAQWASAQEAPIAYVPAAGVTVSGSLSVKNGKVAIGNNGTITAGAQTAVVKLARGGELNVCASTTVHLSRDTSIAGADSALMIALDRGAFEASYKPGKYSDVLLTPDFRILISGPGVADLKIRVSQNGDTCIDNHGANAPYVTVTSQYTGGLYRVQANQRVMFDDGSLSKVVDNEPEPCGCPAPVAVAASGPAPKNPFPLAQSEGLAPAPPTPTKPAAPVGTAQAEVAAPIAYSAAKTPNPAAPNAAGAPPAQAAANAPLPTPTKKKHHGVFHAIGHFFARMFGR